MKQDMEWIERERVFVERLTRYARLATLIMALAALVLAFAILASFAAHAGDPRAAAADLGRAGQATAGAIARDAASADTVPGYAGTGVPERSLTDATMEDAARGVLSDPDRPGGEAGRALTEGAVTRPDIPVSVSDPGVLRGEDVSANPQAPAHGADGLASGSVDDCGADLGDAGRGGSCGRVTYCVGAGCETVEPRANTGFARSASMLNMAVEMGGEEFDRGSLRFFTGGRRTCTIKWGGLANCCKNSGILVGLGGCSASERELAEERSAGNTHYLGRYCSKKVLGVCVRRKRAWCVFGSKLGRILQQQGRSQLGIGWGSCRGLTVAEIERIDFDRIDLSEFTGDLMDGSKEPSVSLPGAGDTRAAMTERIRGFYARER